MKTNRCSCQRQLAEQRPTEETRYVFSTTDTVRYRFPTHANHLVMDRSDAETSEVFVVILEPGEAPPPHVHDDTEQVFYVLRGGGTLYIGEDGSRCFPVREGNIVRIPPHTYHRILSGPEQQLVYLSVDCFLGGRPKQEPTWESHVQVMCRLHGWDLNEVRRAGSLMEHQPLPLVTAGQRTE